MIKTFLWLDPQKLLKNKVLSTLKKRMAFLILSCSRSTADGNCLFNSCSLSMIGDESLQGALWILTCIELYKNVKHYAYYPWLAEAWQEPNHSDFESIKSMFSVTLSDETIVSTYNRKEDNREESIKEEAKLMLETGEDASFVCMCALFEKISTWKSNLWLNRPSYLQNVTRKCNFHQSETLDFQTFPGEHVPGPPSKTKISVRCFAPF